MSYYDRLRFIEIIIAIVALVLWACWVQSRGKSLLFMAGLGWVLVINIIYNIIRMSGVNLDLMIAHGSVSHAIRIMNLGAIAIGGGLMMWRGKPRNG